MRYRRFWSVAPFALAVCLGIAFSSAPWNLLGVFGVVAILFASGILSWPVSRVRDEKLF